ncbi:hypothetical protein lacNasYZ03_02280 [Lactobacillus nasalidis]|uniref:HTH marR-type domain-containing protein n=1 Tax=Lactobacillus nasalidis TaxID=2797258 RepID=A0ABQ3W2L5_9LACO|nr:MarR family transcriptional regulator [Lactobacillus nasalidis]GHV98226.1 hypothetical protein lacNasYZ01_14080 [Lactobacillus nasalidis]GHW00219.1 hypothetical protein lacNasYZ02_16480 [Lactobacillus nasalidis]GHW00541.1 hypothetical protein lacNasYZ03_02280 [Lactobacillus nasalidis]
MDLGLKVKKINDLTAKRGNRELKQLGLTFSQFHALVYLEHCQDGQAPLKQLEIHFQVAQATMAGIVGRLECKGYVKSRLAENDKRVKIVTLTQEGRRICKSAKQWGSQLQKQLALLYSDKELRQFEEYLDRLYEFLAQDEERTAGEKDDQ